MAKVTYQFDAETGKAVAGFLKIVEAQKKAEGQGRKAAKVTNEGLDSMGEKLMGVAKIAAAGFGIKKGADIAVSYLRKIEESSKAVSASLNESVNSLMAFVLVQEGDPETVARTQRAVTVGAKYGMMPGESWALSQSVQSLSGGDFKKGMAAFKEIGIGRRAGIQPEALSDIIAAGKQKGLEPYESTYLMYRAGLFSHKTPEEMSNMAKAFPTWKDPYLATAAAPSVLAVWGQEEYHTYLKRAGEALGMTTGPASKLWKKLGVTPGSENEQIAALAGAGLDTQAKLTEAGISNIRASGGLAAIVKAQKEGTLGERYASLKKEVSPDYISKALSIAYANVPRLGRQQEIETGAAEIAVLKQSEPFGARAQLLELEQQKYYKRFYGTRRGTVFGAHPDEVHKNIGPFDRAALSLMGGGDIQREFAIRRFEEGVATPMEKQNLIQQLTGGRASLPGRDQAATDKTLQALIDNTAALERNTESRKTESADGAIQTE